MEIDLIKHLLNSGFTQEINSEFSLTYTKMYDNIRVAVQLQEDIHIVFADNGDVQRKCARQPFTSIQDLESCIHDILGPNEMYTVPRQPSLSNLLSIINNQESTGKLSNTVVARILGK